MYGKRVNECISWEMCLLWEIGNASVIGIWVSMYVIRNEQCVCYMKSVSIS